MSQISDSAAARRLESIPQADPSQCQVDGLIPQRAFRPRTGAELSSIVQVADVEGWRLVPWGGGTMIHLGAPVLGVEAVAFTQDLSNITEINEENLTVTAEAGVRWSDLQDTLARTGRGYEVPLDPPLPDRATVGGVLASGISGPRQILHGAVRNMVLGLRVVTASGETVSFGGKTVKNVAGLDMCKVYLGSLGSLGIVSEATLRLKPLPSLRITVLVPGDGKALRDLTETVRSSSLYPSQLAWIPSQFSQKTDVLPSNGNQTLVISLEGSPVGVEERWQRLLSIGKNAAPLRLDAERSSQLWNQIRDMPLPPPDLPTPLTLHATVPPAKSGHVAECLQKANPHLLFVLTGTGEAWAHWSLEELKADPHTLVQDLRTAVQAWKGHLVVTCAPLEWRHRLDIWGLDQTLRALMRSLKARLDPRGILAPGRWA